MRKREFSYIDHVPRPKQEPVAYCWNATHYGLLSERLIKEHGCLTKQCPFMEKFNGTAAEFWDKKEKKKEKKKLMQSIRRLYLDRKISLAQYNEWRGLAEEGLMPLLRKKV